MYKELVIEMSFFTLKLLLKLFLLYRYIGFSLHHKTNHLFTVLYGLTVFILILLLNWLCSPQAFYGNGEVEDASDDEDDDDED